MQVFIPLLVWIMCPVLVPFVVCLHIWVSPTYVVNIVAAVPMYVDTYVGLLTNILAWRYQLCTLGNPTLV